MAYHVLTVEVADRRGTLFVCDQCGRRIVIDGHGEITVLDRGDFFATHSGSSGGVGLTISVA